MKNTVGCLGLGDEAARRFWTVEALRKHIRAGDWRHRGKGVNNFPVAIEDPSIAEKAVMAVKERVMS